MTCSLRLFQQTTPDKNAPIIDGVLSNVDSTHSKVCAATAVADSSFDFVAGCTSMPEWQLTQPLEKQLNFHQTALARRRRSVRGSIHRLQAHLLQPALAGSSHQLQLVDVRLIRVTPYLTRGEDFFAKRQHCLYRGSVPPRRTTKTPPEDPRPHSPQPGGGHDPLRAGGEDGRKPPAPGGLAG